MPQRCIIPSCFGEKKRSVFRVPKNIGRREKWLKAVRDVYPNLNVGKNFRVCEKHFRKTDFTSYIADGSGIIVQEVAVIKKRLKQGAVPQFLTNQGQIKMEQDIPFELVIVKEEKVEEMDSTEHQQTNINNVLLIKEENIKIEQELDSEVIVKEENVEET
ncbi:uncharacterized protein LOC123295396 isoform X2 [Chrysoperla carnea]|uniref:uncharacterized protein LOC123295396 isoform X2 n=1 Tax=Chrysoperla carnea TaxID=189513 RepID=UPI001D073775|nr:uncharacterized protein LOC123295396 isoform X2 [Chrysoperla carnea]